MISHSELSLWVLQAQPRDLAVTAQLRGSVLQGDSVPRHGGQNGLAVASHLLGRMLQARTPASCSRLGLSRRQYWPSTVERQSSKKLTQGALKE